MPFIKQYVQLPNVTMCDLYGRNTQFLLGIIIDDKQAGNYSIRLSSQQM
jgi:hypothetical protein